MKVGVIVASFDGDSNPDIIEQSSSDGSRNVFTMHGMTATQVRPLPGANSTQWDVVAVTNAIGKDEPEIYLQLGTQAAEWDLDNLTVVSSGYIPASAGWDIVAPK